MESLTFEKVFTITVNDVNEAPVATGDAVSRLHDTDIYNDLLANDADEDGNSLTAILLSGPSHGTLELDPNGTYFYHPAAGYVGTDSFQYLANDGQLNSQPATVTLTISNQTPTAGNDSFTIAANSSLSGALSGNDADPDGENISAVIVAGPAVGTLTDFNADGSFTYVPPEDYSGLVTWAYKTTDGVSDSAYATVTIQVTAPTLTIDLDGKAAESLSGDPYVQEELEEAPGVYVDDGSSGFPAELLVRATWVADATRTLTWDDTKVALYDSGSLVSSGITLDEGAGNKTFTVQALSGFDLSEYVPVSLQVRDGQNQVLGGDAVQLIRVGISLRMDGVPEGGNTLIGGFVRINADNDNGSAVTDSIPCTRDFDVVAEVAAENDLVRFEVGVRGPAVLPGVFVLAISQGESRIRLWDSPTKTTHILPGNYTQATLPRTLYVEGIDPSEGLRDILLGVTYLDINLQQGQVTLGGDFLRLTVTPVLNFFTRSLGAVAFTNGMGNGAQGMIAFGTAPNNAAGITFDAQITRTGLGGRAIFIQNLTNVINNSAGVAGGAGFQFGGFLPNVAAIGAMNNLPNAGNTFPFVDTLNLVRPDYAAVRDIGPANPDTQIMSAVDSPTTGVPTFPAGHALAGQSAAIFLTRIDVKYEFSMFLVWRFELERGVEILYPFARRQWSVTFIATRNQAGAINPAVQATWSVDTIAAAAGVTALADFERVGAGVTMIVAGPRPQNGTSIR